MKPIEAMEEDVDLSRAKLNVLALRQLAAAHAAAPKPAPGPYYARLLAWMMQGPAPWEAYTERSGLFLLAKCYRQAQADAREAVELAKAARAAAHQVGDGTLKATSAQWLKLSTQCGNQ